jgi:chemotaxis signal transduction protein
VTTWLFVRCAERALAVPAGMIEGLLEVPPVLPAPGVVAAVRGVAPYRGRLVPLVHLGAAISDGPLPSTVCAMAIAVLVSGRRMLLEVDEAADVVMAPEAPLPQGWHGGWAVGAIRRPEGLVPVLDLDWLMARLTRAAENATA